MEPRSSQLIQPQPTLGERERIRARLEVLQRVQEGIAGHDRPAMRHAILQLMKLESGALRQLERGSGASSSTGAGSASSDAAVVERPLAGT